MQVGCVITVLVLGVTSILLFFATSMIHRELIDKLNDRLPANQRIRAWGRPEFFWVLRRHAEMFPQSRRSRLVWSLGILGILTFIAFWIVVLTCFGSVVPSK